ncbi:hypothetical protein DNH61_25200 [Paenibacillus sambharensis]|uniref:Transport permease protein n=1 Tax=Paenibacillus sambharensis TaxID=1803190 RepID=A0A2W1L2F7_9BACL|nr:ABC transporter permease [Paenibacillus sambharensis]PZD93079.1 hypothetical protein DNH61_25200 [Paenibacillus sambharensis]
MFDDAAICGEVLGMRAETKTAHQSTVVGRGTNVSRIKGLFKIELKLLLKQPIILIFGILGPIAFLVMQTEIIGNMVSFQETEVSIVDLALPMFTMMSIAVLGVGNVGIGMAYTRLIKFLKRLRLTPVKKTDYILANFLVQLIMAILTTFVLLIVVVTVYSVDLTDRNLFMFFSILFLNFLMCYFLGLLIGSIFEDPKTSQSMAMVVYFALVFLGGFTFPIEMMPEFMQYISYVTPTTHAVKLLQFAWNGTNLFADYHFIVVVLATSIFGILGFRFFKFN